QASGYRFTEASIARALSSGETAASMLDFLNELSLTGVPQPLGYLIDRGASRHGLIRVTADPDTRTTLVRSPDETLLRTLEVDQSLTGLGLVAGGGELRTRAPRDVVFWALSDARYP
ncbi:helicase-associated domain-containing protein, partial [Burkholderia sp. SIMBA_024]|uniref:helicase-associated domain-containing protein n=1 Tax=Burkholderia sp. SIMBA_024 TaxID=3085768 RepID=UPI00397CC285